MSSHEIVDRQHRAREAMLADPEDPNETAIVEAASCECGLPEPCCDLYCSIESCDWLVY
jgi:hypothetical protein